MMAMDRRCFVRGAGLSVGAIATRSHAQTRALELTIDSGKELATMPQDFIGLSYESSQLADPAFFAASNTTLVGAFRKLCPRGVLRLGGNLSDVTLWKGSAANSISPQEAAKVRGFYEWRLTDSKAASERPATIGPEGIEALGGFLHATEWKLLYGLNLGTGTPERAAEEAALVAKHAGDHLLAFQVGNEADLYGPAFREAGWNFDRYWSEYQRFVKAVRVRVPQAPFAGPDVATKADWVTQFAQRAKGDVVLVSSHYYAMGPAGAPGIDARKLLSDDPRLAREMPILVAAGKTAGVPYRMTEGNTCYHGGQPGVSDAFASALWASDYLLRVAQAGYAGVNLHGGGEGYYAPLTGEPNATKPRPEYYGMLLAQRFAGATFVRVSDAGEAHDVSAYAARANDALVVAAVNKSSSPVQVRIRGAGARATECWTLSAPSLDAKDGVQFAQNAMDERTVPGYSGVLWQVPLR
ncbi:MAG: hypothetical protein ACJ71S_12345 [Acidobacteriaceae bacterium]